jgi:nucleotide-binding universal stress UspA family protein
MFKHILVPTDGSKLSAKGVKQAIEMAKALRAKITAVHVVDDYHQRMHDQDEGFMMPVMPTLKKDFEDRLAAHANEILSLVQERARKAGVKCNTAVATGDTPYEMIIKQARKSKCDLIMMASHGRSGIKGILLGSETAKVLTHSKIPVLVVR